MGSAGPVDLDSAYVANAYSEDVINTIRQMLKQQQTHLLDKELVRRNDIVIQGNAGLSQALENSPPLSMPDTPLGAQLNMIARIINANQLLGMKRNIFFVGMKGFDSHQSLNTSHPELLQALGDGLAAFQNEMNLAGLANNVTTFTASDFGRSLTSNGRGSDHGWGGHQFVMGGAVKERSWVGALPSLILGAEDDIGQGRLLPNISVDQYSATLARWMGVSDSDMQTVLPGIVNFDQTDLGFMT